MTLEAAIALAARLHRGQVDKQGEPYILHCLRVLLLVEPEARVVAVLHDAAEDSAWTPDDADLEDREREALSLLTRPMGWSYEDYVARIAGAPGHPGRIARAVKLADIHDNLARITPELGTLGDRYIRARRVLLGHLDRG